MNQELGIRDKTFVIAKPKTVPVPHECRGQSRHITNIHHPRDRHAH